MIRAFLNKLAGYYEQKIHRILPDTVLSGPFQAMKIPSEFTGHGSSFFPKLFGSYEKELHPYLNKILQSSDYNLIVDIGCAEGYYAVGMALHYPKAKVLAVDINEHALALTKKLAKYNEASNLKPLLGLNMEQLKKKIENQNGRVLIISDCEGYEYELFHDFHPDGWVDYLIEIHDHHGSKIKDALIKNFESTHNLEIEPAKSDLYKVINYILPLKTDYLTKRYIVAERRPYPMYWLIVMDKNR